MQHCLYSWNAGTMGWQSTAAVDAPIESSIWLFSPRKVDLIVNRFIVQRLSLSKRLAFGPVSQELQGRKPQTRSSNLLWCQKRLLTGHGGTGLAIRRPVRRSLRLRNAEPVTAISGIDSLASSHYCNVRRARLHHTSRIAGCCREFCLLTCALVPA